MFLNPVFLSPAMILIEARASGRAICACFHTYVLRFARCCFRLIQTR